jgi:hypothetical protein
MGCTSLAEVIMPGRLFKELDKDSLFHDPKKIYFRFYATADGDASYWDDMISKRKKEEEKAEPIPQKEASDEKNYYPAQNVVTDDKVVAPEKEEEEKSSAKVAENIVPVEVVNRVAVVVTEEQEAIPNVKRDKNTANDVSVYYGVNNVESSENIKEKISAVMPVEVVKDIVPPLVKHDYKEYDDFIINDGVLVKFVGTKQNVIVPEFITEIGENAFSNSNVVTVNLNEGIQKISVGAFSWCEKLKKINLPRSLIIIEDNAFADCGALEDITIPYGVKYIGASAFHACCSIKQLILPPSLTSIGRRAFDFCIGLDEVRMPAGITVLSDGMFSHCEGLKSVTLPEGLVTISDWTFAECYSLSEINLPEGLKKIGEVAFMNCHALVGLNIPQSVVEIGRQAYVGCYSLAAAFVPIHLEKKIKPAKVFQGLKNLQIHYVDLT